MRLEHTTVIRPRDRRAALLVVHREKTQPPRERDAEKHRGSELCTRLFSFCTHLHSACNRTHSPTPRPPIQITLSLSHSLNDPPATAPDRVPRSLEATLRRWHEAEKKWEVDGEKKHTDEEEKNVNTGTRRAGGKERVEKDESGGCLCGPRRHELERVRVCARLVL